MAHFTAISAIAPASGIGQTPFISVIRLARPSELQFCDEADLRLIVTEDMRRRFEPLIAAELDILVDEDVLPRNKDVVVYDQRSVSSNREASG